jgi:hypothetical protein
MVHAMHQALSNSNKPSYHTYLLLSLTVCLLLFVRDEMMSEKDDETSMLFRAI